MKEQNCVTPTDKRDMVIFYIVIGAFIIGATAVAAANLNSRAPRKNR